MEALGKPYLLGGRSNKRTKSHIFSDYMQEGMSAKKKERGRG